MLLVARRYWWPSLKADITEHCGACIPCKKFFNKPKAEAHHWSTVCHDKSEIMQLRSPYSAWVHRSDGKVFLLNRLFKEKALCEAGTENRCSVAVTFAALHHPQVNVAPGPLVLENPHNAPGQRDTKLQGHPPNKEHPPRPPPAPPTLFFLDIPRQPRNLLMNTPVSITGSRRRSSWRFGPLGGL